MKIQFLSFAAKKKKLDKLIGIILFVSIPFSINAQSYFSQINPEYSFITNNTPFNPHTFLFSKCAPIKDPGFFEQSYIVKNKIKRIVIRKYEPYKKSCVTDSVIHEFELSHTFDLEGRLTYSYTIHPCSKIKDTNDIVIINYSLANPGGSIQYSYIHHSFVSSKDVFKYFPKDTVNYFVSLNKRGKPEEVIRKMGDQVLGSKTFLWKNDQLQFVYTRKWGGACETDQKIGSTYFYSFPSYESIDSLNQLYKRLGYMTDAFVGIVKNGKLERSFKYWDRKIYSKYDYSYDNSGNLIKIEGKDEEYWGKRRKDIYKFTYNENNNLHMITHEDYDNALYTWFFTYDEKSDLLKKISLNSPYNSNDKWIFNYEFY